MHLQLICGPLAARVYPVNSILFSLLALRGSMYVTMPNFIKVGQTIAKIWLFNGF